MHSEVHSEDFDETEVKERKDIFLPVFHSAILIFTSILGIGFIIPFLADFSKRIGGEKFVGLIYSGFAFARMFAVPLSSIMSDKYGRKPFIAVGLVLYSITSFLYSHANNFLSLFLVRVVHGVASSMILPVAFAYALDNVPKGNEGKVAAILGGSLLLGFGVGPVVGGFIGKFFGEFVAFYSMGVMGLVALFISLIFLKDKDREVVDGHKRDVLSEIKDILRSRVFLMAFLIWFFVIWQRGVVISYSPLLLENFGFDKFDVGLAITLYAVLSSVLQYSFARFVDSVKDKFSFALLFAFLSSIPILLLSFEFRSKIFFFLIFLFSGSFSALSYPFLMAEVGSEAKEKERIGGTIGFMDWAFSLGNIVGPTFMGLISAKFGVSGIFFVLGIFHSLIFLMLLILKNAILRKRN
jgi:predicted MFS family arabinose efflux permease